MSTSQEVIWTCDVDKVTTVTVPGNNLSTPPATWCNITALASGPTPTSFVICPTCQQQPLATILTTMLVAI